MHLYPPPESKTNRRHHHIQYGPVPRLCCLVQFVAAGFIRAPQQHRCPLRTCQVIHSSGSGWGLAERLLHFLLQPGSPRGFATTQFPLKWCLSLSVSPWWAWGYFKHICHIAACCDWTNGLCRCSDFKKGKTSDPYWAYLFERILTGISVLTDPSLTDRSMQAERWIKAYINGM